MPWFPFTVVRPAIARHFAILTADSMNSRNCLIFAHAQEATNAIVPLDLLSANQTMRALKLNHYHAPAHRY